MGQPAALRRMTYEFNLNEFIKAGIPLIVTETRELASVKECVEEVAKHFHRSLFYYIPDGNIQCRIYSNGKNRNPGAIAENFSRQDKNKNCTIEDFFSRLIEEPQNTDVSRTAIPQNSIFVVSGMYKEQFSNKIEEMLIQSITDGSLSNNHITILFTNDVISLPDKIRRLAMENNFEDITSDERFEFIKKELEIFNKDLENYAKKKNQTVNKNRWMFKQECLKAIAEKAQCLTLYETRNIINLCLVKHPTDTNADEILRMVEDFSSQSLANNKALTKCEFETDIGKIGDFDRVIDYLKSHAEAFQGAAMNPDLELPRGIALIGLPGTGKSLMANMVGSILGLPTLHLRTQDVFNLYVGVSEERIRIALEQVDAMNGCVLVIDEADKQFAGNAESTDADNGVTARVFGVILEWLQEHKSRTFVVMTLNATKDMPPELLRAGRFDRVFFADLPAANGRRKIFETYLKDSHFTDEEWKAILAASRYFVGAEIRWIVQDALMLADSRSKEVFRKTRQWTCLPPTAEEVMQAIAQRKPLYFLERDKLDKVRQKYTTNCISVSYDNFNQELFDSTCTVVSPNAISYMQRIKRVDEMREDIRKHPERYGIRLEGEGEDGLPIDMSAEAMWKAEVEGWSVDEYQDFIKNKKRPER